MGKEKKKGTMPSSSLRVISELSGILHKLNKYLLVTESKLIAIWSKLLLTAISLLVLLEHNTSEFRE